MTIQLSQGYRLPIILGILALLACGWLVYLRKGTAPPPKPPAAVTRLSETHWRVARSLKDRYLKEEGRLNREFHLKPTMAEQPDLVKDLIVAKLLPDSPMAQAGFRQNDRILKINGTPVATLSRAINLVHEVEASSRLTVQVERDGRIIDYQFDFE